MDLQTHRLTLHQLRVFRAVARHGSFTRAAEEIGLTQSAVSVQMRELARLLGVPLVQVIGRAVHLTPAGSELADEAAAVEEAVAEIGRRFARLRGGEAGQVRVGASSTVGTYVLPARIGAFAADHPGVEVTLEIQNSALIEARVLRGEFDLGVIGSAPDHADLVADALIEDELFFACSPRHPLAGRSAPPARLGGERLIVREPGSGTQRALDERLPALGVRFPRTMQLGSIEAIKEAVQANLGIGWFSALSVKRELDEGRLARIRVRGLGVRRSFFAIRHRRARGSPALATLLSYLRTP